MKTCYIVAAAELAEERLRPEEGDLVIAADAGLRHLARLGIQPDLALGDFDSLGYVPEAPSVEVCPVRKDDTDTMAALKRAHELGFRRVLIFGGLGGARFDHSLANVQSLAWADAHGMDAILVGRGCALTAISDGAALEFDARCSGDFSAFCFGPEASGVCETGLSYSSTARCSRRTSLAVSNSFTGSAPASPGARPAHHLLARRPGPAAAGTDKSRKAPGKVRGAALLEGLSIIRLPCR
ncbi:MAG: thiamine diphosphokinase [Oscillospiraceae bacterium]